MKTCYNFFEFCLNFHFVFEVSNEVPEHPVVSPASGSVFERRLIEKYIADNGVDPINGKELTVEQLIEIKSISVFCLLSGKSSNNCLFSFSNCKAQSSICNKHSSCAKVITGRVGCSDAEFIYFKTTVANCQTRTKVL